MATIEEIIDALRKATTSEKKKIRDALGRDRLTDIGEGESPEKNISIDRITRENKLLEDQLKINDQIIAKQQSLLETETSRYLRNERANMMRDTQIESLDEEIRRMEEVKRLGGEIDEQRLKNLKETKKISENIKPLTEILTGGDKGGDNLRSYISGNISKQIDSMFVDLADTYRTEMETVFEGFNFGDIDVLGDNTDLIDAFASLGKIISKFALVAAALFAVEMATLAIKLMDVENAAMRTLGATRELASGITKTYAETREFGVTIDEASKAFESLYTGYNDFTLLNESSRNSLLETTAIMSKLGVSADASAQSMMHLTKAMNMSQEAAEQTLINMQLFAEQTGISVQQLTQDFLAQAPALAKLGDQGFRSFQRLELAAKATGLRVERLMAIVSKFDTFEGAAESAGKLNAALGGNFVNAMDLMMATDPVDRFNQIRDALTNSGLEFDTMGYYQREFIAQSAGLSDASELALVMKGRYDLLSDSVMNNSQSYEDAAEKAQKLQSFQDKLNTVFAQMIPILEPLIDFFILLTDFMLENADTIKLVTGLLLVLGGVISALSTGGLSLSASIASIGVGLGILASGADKAGEKVTVLGVIANGIIFVFKQLAALYSGIILPFVTVFSFLGKLLGPVLIKIGEFANLLNQNYGIFEKFLFILKIIGVIMGGVLMTAIGAIAGPIAGFIAGIVAVVSVIASLAELLFETPFNPPNFLQGLFEIATGFSFISNAADAAISVLKAMSGVIRAVGETFNSILTGISGFFELMTSDAAIENILNMVGAIRELAKATNEVSVGGAIALSTLAIAATPLAVVGAATEVTNNVISGNNNSGTENLMTFEQPVELKINGDVLERFVISVVGQHVRTIKITQR